MISKILPVFAASVMAVDPETLVVPMHDVSEDDEITGLACAGLMNRDGSTQLAWTNKDSDDAKWWNIFSENHPHKEVTWDEYVAACFNSGAAKGYIKYDLTDDKESIPQMLTMAAVLDAIPFHDESKLPELSDGSKPKLLFNLSKDWAGYDSYAATTYLYENHLKDTNGLSKMNPGF